MAPTTTYAASEDEEVDADIDCALALSPESITEVILARMEKDLTPRPWRFRYWLRAQRRLIVSAVIARCNTLESGCDEIAVKRFALEEMRRRRHNLEWLEDRGRSAFTLAVVVGAMVGTNLVGNYISAHYPTVSGPMETFYKPLSWYIILWFGRAFFRRVLGGLGKVGSRIRSGDSVPAHGLDPRFVEAGTDQLLGDLTDEQHRFVNGNHSAVGRMDGASEHVRSLLKSGDREHARVVFLKDLILTVRFFEYVPMKNNDEFRLAVRAHLTNEETGVLRQEAERRQFVEEILNRLPDWDSNIGKNEGLLDYYRRMLFDWFDLEDL